MSLIEDMTDGAIANVMADRFERVVTADDVLDPAFEFVPPSFHPNHPSTDRFLDVLDDVRDLHFKKGADYGNVTDPFANLRASEGFGIEPWLGTMVRLNDKINRVMSWCQKGHLVNDSLEDDLRDIATYGAIALTLFYEAQMEQESE